MLRLNLLLIINIFLSGFLAINIINFNQKIENITSKSKKDWIYNYSENYLFIKDNKLFSIKDNKLLWKTKINNNNFNILELKKENLIILLSNNNIKVLSSKTGKLIWERNLDEYNYKLPSLNSENIFLLGDRKIYFIDIKSGNIKKIIKLKDEAIKLEDNKNKKKEVSVKIVYLKSDKKYIDTNKYFFSLYKLDIKGNLNNKFILQKSKKDEYFHKSAHSTTDFLKANNCLEKSLIQL